MTPYKYLAFISYKREDEKWAASLQRKLEGFNLSVTLKKDNPDLPDPLMVFRDKTDLSLGRLQARLKDGLSQSKFLVVVCSPNSRDSEWVGKEIQEFIDKGKADLVIPYVVDGKPYSGGDDECFPQVLKNLKGPDELLAANVNEMGEDYAIVKVMAYMLGVEVDSLWNRYEREQQKKIQQRKEEQDKLADAQNRLFMEQAERMIDAGENIKARELALMVFPDRVLNPEQEALPEAERALRKASLMDSGSIRLEWDDHLGDFKSCCYQAGFLFAQSSSGIRKYDVSTLRPVKTAFISEDWGIDWCSADFIAAHHDGRSLFVAMHDKLYLTDSELRMPEELYSNKEWIRLVCARPGKDEIAILDTKNHLTFFDLKARAARKMVKLGRGGFSLSSHLYTSMTYSPDGVSLVLCHSLDTVVTLSADSGARVKKGKRSGVSTLRYYGTDGTCYYSTHLKNELYAVGPQGDSLYSIPFPTECTPTFFALDGTSSHCAAICSNRPGSIIQVGLMPRQSYVRPKFDYLNLPPKLLLSHRNIEVSSNSRWVVYRESNQLHDLKTNRSIHFKFIVDYVDFSYDNSYLLVGNPGAIQIVGLETMALLPGTISRESGYILSASFIDGTHDIVLSYGEDESRKWVLYRYSMHTHEELKLGYSSVKPLRVRYIDGDTSAEVVYENGIDSCYFGHMAEVVNLADGSSLAWMGRDGNVICSGDASGELLICSREKPFSNSISAIFLCNVNRNEKVLLDIHDEITIAQFSRKGDLLFLSSEKRIYVVNTSTKAVILDFAFENDGTAVAFSDDDRSMTVFALSSFDALTFFPVEIETIESLEERIRSVVIG